MVATVIMAVMMTSTVFAGTSGENIDEPIFYSNEVGLKLTKSEYNYLNKYINKYTIDSMSKDEYNYLIEDIDNNITTNVKYVYSIYTVTTAMKKITMEMYNVQPSAKTVSLTCEWLAIPQCKSFDVIAFRINKPSVTLNFDNTTNVQGYQYYDGKKINYPYSSDNIKYFSNGLGVSMNIVDSTSKSLVCTFKTTFGIGDDSLMVFGSYQHAVENVTLAQSQKYTLHTLGLGNVIYFSDSIIGKYDRTPGLEVIGSTGDMR